MTDGALPDATIGILGGGQLGRMLAMAAARLGVRSHIFAPEPDSPAFDVAGARTCAAYDDQAALAGFAQAVDVVTYEFENVPAATAAFLARFKPVRPGERALLTTQDRLTEKQFLGTLGIATAPWARVDDAGALAPAVARIGRPAILKTRRFGYDGKGQTLLREGDDLAAVFRSLGGRPCVLEGVVDFVAEISVIGARGSDGAFAAFDVCENTHAHHILHRTTVPAAIGVATAQAAARIAARIAEALDYVGIIAVELFVSREADGRETLRVNEIAPRVHNSGHWTLDGAATSQFEQHVRAILGWPLGATARRGRIDMQNLVGEDAAHWPTLLAEPGASLHLYGKHYMRAGRKLGHVTRITPEVG